MTLFYEASGHESPRFRAALESYFEDEPDERTLELLSRQRPSQNR